MVTRSHCGGGERQRSLVVDAAAKITGIVLRPERGGVQHQRSHVVNGASRTAHPIPRKKTVLQGHAGPIEQPTSSAVTVRRIAIVRERAARHVHRASGGTAWSIETATGIDDTIVGNQTIGQRQRSPLMQDTSADGGRYIP